MSRVLKVTRLHLNKFGNVVVTPLGIIAVVMLVSIIIVLAIQRSTGMPIDSPEYIAGARWNQAMVWALPGFLVYYGVQGIGTTYPFALALGTTRRNFVIGTLLANMLNAAYIAVLLMVLLAVELATNHWFIGAYVLDVHFLGAGNFFVLGATAFLATMFCLTVGGLFAAVWVRFGSRGPAVLGLALGLALALTLLLLAPYFADIIGQLTGGVLALVVGVVIVVALVATWFAMRRASVR